MLTIFPHYKPIPLLEQAKQQFYIHYQQVKKGGSTWVPKNKVLLPHEKPF
jgi:hypothetical protein